MDVGFYKRLLDNCSDLIWTTDVEGRITYINNKITKFGYEMDGLIGRPMLEILNVRHMGKDRTGGPLDMGTQRKLEMVIEDKGGNPHRVVVSSSPLYDDNNNIIGVMGVLHDDTEIYSLMTKLKHEERLASLGRLATGIAHEIRNPLSSIKMNLDILGKRLSLPHQEQEHFDIAKEGVANLEKIVTEFIYYAKPMPMNMTRQDLHKTIEDTVAMARLQCDEAKLSVVLKFAETMPPVSFDKVKVQQVLLNILLNALQASKHGGTVEITTSLTQSPSRARVDVADHGEGIIEENVQFVFDPFFTTKKSGTGLGLSIVRSIMISHNGTVNIQSKHNEGTTVTLEFPIT